jgi:ribose 5-phosphate isomerase B
MKIVIASDHGGYEYKQVMIPELLAAGYDVKDLGAFELQPLDDYPDYAGLVAAALMSGQADRGVLICGSGVGVSVAANKYRGVRAGVCHDTYSAHQAVEHDDVNVLCIGQRVIGIELAREIIYTFLGAIFSNEERHARRLNKVKSIESSNLK